MNNVQTTTEAPLALNRVVLRRIFGRSTKRQKEILLSLLKGDKIVCWDSWDNCEFKRDEDGELAAKNFHRITESDGKMVREDTLTKFLNLGIVRPTYLHLGENDGEHIGCKVLGEPDEWEIELIRSDARWQPKNLS